MTEHVRARRWRLSRQALPRVLPAAVLPRVVLPRVVLPAVVLSLALVVAGCAPSNDNGQNSLDPKGKNAQRIDDLFIPITWIAIVVGVLVVGATVLFAIKFRQRPGHNDDPKQIHGSTPLEIGWTIVPAVILAIISVPTIATIFTIAQEPTGEVLETKVVGKQFWWQVEYGKQAGIDQGFVTAGEIHMIAGVPLRIRLESEDVIHSFWIPELGGKQDVVPGRKQSMTLYGDEPGTYLGQCAEYCGLAHADMRMRVIVQDRADFEAWAGRQQRGPDQAYVGEIEELTGETYACTNCHSFDDSSQTTYGPNLVHLGSRDTIAGGTYELDRENLVNWLLDAPAMVPMQSKTCREPTATPGLGCIGMPSFTKNTPKGQPVMSQADAETIADYLLANQ